MIKPEMVPDEATVAAAVQLSNGKNTTQAIAAALNAWPNGYTTEAREAWPAELILPLPQETRDDER